MGGKNDNESSDSGAQDASLHHASKQAREKAIEKMKATQEKVAEEANKEKTDETSAPTSSASLSDFAGEASDEEPGDADAPQKQMVDESTGKPLLRQVKVYSPYKVYFDNDAFSVSASNGTGPFDILPGHKNFLSLLLPGELVIRARAGEEKLKIERGIMHVSGDVIRVFLDV